MKIIARTLAAAAALCAFSAAPALADSETFVFRVSETRLTSQDEAERVYIRLSEEAARYCRALDLSARSTLTDCRLDVVENVVEAVGDARLSAVHDARLRERTLAEAG